VGPSIESPAHESAGPVYELTEIYSTEQPLPQRLGDIAAAPGHDLALCPR